MLSVNTEYWFVLQYKVLADCGPPITYDGVLVQHVYSNLANSVERQALERVGQIGRRNASMHCALSSLVGCAPGLGVSYVGVNAFSSSTLALEVALPVLELLVADVARGTRMLCGGIRPLRVRHGRVDRTVNHGRQQTHAHENL